MLKIVHNKKWDWLVREKALVAISEHGPADQAGPVLRKALTGPNDAMLRMAATWGVVRHRLIDMLPELERITRTENEEDFLVGAALRAFVALADQRDTERLLLQLLNPKENRILRCIAADAAGSAGYRSAVPLLLPMLDEPAPVIARYDPRITADHALRILAKLPNGVGYEPARRNSDTWRTWWAKNAKSS